MVSSGVTKQGARVLSCLLAASVVAGAVLAGAGDAEARSKRKQFRKARPAIAASSSFIAGSNYAALVVDAKTGRVLYEKNADAQRFPASVTKVMTLYLVFEDLERGRFSLGSRLTMTGRCAAQAPSKLGMRPGQTIAVEDAIRALVTKSANDVACAIAENLEGSESAFGERMTRKARALGMSETVYRNASGLPNPSHVTSARDLVTLGRAVQDRFPRYYGYFGTRVFTYAGRNMPNHNRLLGRMEGVDGIKTGYTNASGFNLLTSVKSNGRAVVAVVMGGRTGASRDAHMRELIAFNLPKASTGGRSAPLVAEAGERAPLRARPAVVAATPSPLNPPAEIRVTAASVPLPPAAPEFEETTEAAVPAPAPVPMPAAVRVAATTPASPLVRRTVAPESDLAVASAAGRTTTPQTMRWIVGAPSTTGSVAKAEEAELPEAASAYVEPAPRLAPARPARVASSSEARDIEGAPAAAPTAETQAVRKGWLIQIGATTEVGKAQDLLSDAKSRGGRALAAAEAFTETYAKGDTTYYRARFAGFDERSAGAACKALKRSAMSCFAIKN